MRESHSYRIAPVTTEYIRSNPYGTYRFWLRVKNIRRYINTVNAMVYSITLKFQYWYAISEEIASFLLIIKKI